MTGHVPAASLERYETLIRELAADLVRLGVVAVHDPGGLSLQEGLGAGIAAFRALDERGRAADPRPRLHPRGADRGSVSGRAAERRSALAGGPAAPISAG